MNHNQIKKQGINSAKWAIFDKAGSQVFLLINTLVLARLLDPKDIGLVSMLYIFMSLSSLFVDSGMAGGLIRKQDLNDRDCSTFFYFNISVAVACYLILFFSAPAIARFYDEPQIVPLLRLLGINIIVSSLGLIHKTLLVKDLKVRLITRSSLLGSTVGMVLGIICAYKGLGAYSLVILNVSQSIITVILIWRLSKWRPIRVFSKSSFNEMYQFGIGLFFSTFIDIIFKNIYQPFIGKLFSPLYAGFYYQARRLYELPILTISSVVDSITYPMLVRYQGNAEELQRVYQQIVKLLIFISIPIVVTLMLLSDKLVFVLLGEKWMFAASLLQILSVSGLFLILETSTRSLLKVEARTKLIFKLEVVKKVIIVITILLTYSFGIKALMYGLVFNSITSFALNQYFTNIKIADLKTIALIVLNGVFMGAGIYSVTYFIKNPYLGFFSGGFVGIIVYATLSYMMKLKEQKQLLSIITAKLG